VQDRAGIAQLHRRLPNADEVDLERVWNCCLETVGMSNSCALLLIRLRKIKGMDLYSIHVTAMPALKMH